MLQVAICDDVPEELAHLEALLLAYETQRELDIVQTHFMNGFLFLEEISKKKAFNICFLDIYMSGITGLEVAKELRQVDKETHLVFTTSSTEFAIEGYKVQASNYLLKPVGKEDFFLAMDEILRKLQPIQQESLCLILENGAKLIPFQRIVMVETNKNHALVTLRNKEKMPCVMTFGELREILLSRPNFYLVSRSIIVNFDAVVGTKSGFLLLESGEEILIPRRKKQEITSAFLNYTM